MKNLKDKVAVITGAGSGIGRALALALAQEGALLALNDWNKEALEETIKQIPEGQAMGESFDVADKKSVFDFALRVVDHYGKVNIVVNNAGIAHEQRRADAFQFDLYEKVLGVNLWGVIYGSKAFLPYLEQESESSLVNISSVFGIVGQPLQGPYVISKFAVRGFTETLRNELRNAKSQVSITCVHPGGIRTNIINNLDTKNTKRRDKFAKAFEKMAKTSADEAARQIVQAIKTKKVRLLIGRDAKMMDLAARLFPSSYDKYVYRGIDFKRFEEKT